MDGKKTAESIKGWLSFGLTILPVLHFIPHPAVQALITPLNEFFLAFLGGTGAIGLAASNPIIGRKKN